MQKKIVIAGFGETGILVAINLSHYKHYSITGITPKGSLLSGQELGARITQPEVWKKNYLTEFKQYKKLSDVNIVNGLIRYVNPSAQYITVINEKGVEQHIDYDVLVIATGVSNGFWRQVNFDHRKTMESKIQQHYQQFKLANTIAVVGGGASGVSTAYNLATTYPNKVINFYYSQDLPLPGYHPKVRQDIINKLKSSSINLFPHHRAELPEKFNDKEMGSGTIRWLSGQDHSTADVILWAVGQQIPNSDFLPEEFLDRQGFVKVDQYLRIPNHDNIFAVGDIAASDPYRSSARNWGFEIVAHNIHATLSENGQLKNYKPSQYRWGSILGVQEDGLTVYQANGSKFRFPKWSIDRLLFPFFVRKMIYKGVKKY